MITEIENLPAPELIQPPQSAYRPTDLAPVPARVLCFGIPAADAVEFAAALPWDAQQEVRRMLNCLRTIHAAANRTAACRRIAAAMQTLGKGYSVQTLDRKYRVYAKSGDWRSVVNGAKVPVMSGRSGSSALPKDFVKWFQRLCENNQRSCSGGIRALREIYRTHLDGDGRPVKAIPGYAAWPEADAGTGWPAGWTERNLYRCTPDKYALALSRQGIASASQHRLKVHKTRVGLRVGQFYQLDDHEYNVKVRFPGQIRVMRPRGFTAIDVLSSLAFAKSFKPTLYDDVREKKQALTEKDFMWFVIHTLCDFGYRADELGTALCVEWGTAAVRSDFEQRIVDATNGRVRIERGGRFHMEQAGSRLTVDSQMRGQVKGNFRFKALIESFWNIIDNHLAALPGQVGKDRNAAPEQMHGMERYSEKLAKVALTLSPERAAQLKYPVLDWPAFLDAALKSYDAIAQDTEHDCNDWERCGFTASEFRVEATFPWLPVAKLLELPEDKQAVMRALITQDDRLTRSRRMSRQEVFHRGRGELTRLAACHWPALMGPQNALRGGEALTVRNGMFEFEDADMAAGEVFRFVAGGGNGNDGREGTHGSYLGNGEKFVCFVNPFNPAVLVACDAKLRVVAECRPAVVAGYNDREKLHQAMGEARRWEAKQIQAHEERHAPETRALLEMRRHNAEVISGTTPAAERKELREQEALRDQAEAALLAATKPKTLNLEPSNFEP